MKSIFKSIDYCLSDSISFEFENENTCGIIEYDIFGANDEAAPEFITIAQTEGESSFDIEVDVKNYYGNPISIQLKVVAKLPDYSTFVASVESEFDLEIAVLDPFVFVPPEPKPEL